MEYAKGYVYELMDKGGPTDVRESYFKEAVDEMFMKSAFVFFDFSEPRVFFFLDYLAVMVLFGTLGAAITYVLNMSGKKNSV